MVFHFMVELLCILSCFHFPVVLLKVDCGISTNDEISQTDLWHPVIVPHLNSVSSLKQSVLSQMFVKADLMAR